MTDREDEAKPYDQRMLELLEEAAALLKQGGGGAIATARWRERYAKLLADRAKP